MLTYLEVMTAWVSDHQAATTMRITHRESRTDVPKRSAVVGFETDLALGSLAVWETGEVEAEVLVVETLERPLVVSALLGSPVELNDVLDRVVAAMESV